MDSDQGLLSASDRPDLEEFLTALSGFLENQSSSPSDPGYLRFLSMFCRSVGASEGHFLRRKDVTQLESVTSVGLGEDFNTEFNAERAQAGEPCPLDEAFEKKEVVAIVDLTKESTAPAWFMRLMKKHGFQSLVAVPLLGQSQALGILCAYYHDICLFDQNTMDHLMMIGRMVGGATERSIAAEGTVRRTTDHALDAILSALTERSHSKIQQYQLLVDHVGELARPAGLLCGPTRKTADGLVLTLAAGLGVPDSAVSHRLVVPPFIEKLLQDRGSLSQSSGISATRWGALNKLVQQPNVFMFAAPLLAQDKLQGCLIGWKPTVFRDDELLLIGRLTRIVSLSLNMP